MIVSSSLGNPLCAFCSYFERKYFSSIVGDKNEHLGQKQMEKKKEKKKHPGIEAKYNNKWHVRFH